jgi:hypothetical protein
MPVVDLMRASLPGLVALVVACGTTASSTGPDASVANANDASAGSVDASVVDAAVPAFGIDSSTPPVDAAIPDASCDGPVGSQDCCNGLLCNGFCAGPDGGPTHCACFDVDGGCASEDMCCAHLKTCANNLQCAP